MLVLGLDPGVSGAFAIFDPSQPTIVHAFDLPVVAGVLDGRNLAARIREASPDHAVIEDVHAMPKQGVSSTFKFGRAFGTAIGIIEALGLPATYVVPTKWKRHFGLDSDAEKSRRAALNHFPGSAELFTRKKDHNRAEAALLARYGADVVLRDPLAIGAVRPALASLERVGGAA